MHNLGFLRGKGAFFSSWLAAASFYSPSFLLAAASFSLSFYMLRNPSLYFTK